MTANGGTAASVIAGAQLAAVRLNFMTELGYHQKITGGFDDNHTTRQWNNNRTGRNWMSEVNSSEKDLWMAVIARAALDCLGFFSNENPLELQFERLKYKIENPPKPKKPLKNPRKTFKERTQHIDIRSARSWFITAGQDFCDVCDWAGLNWKDVQEKIVPQIKNIEALEEKLFEIEVVYLGKIAKKQQKEK